MPEGVEAVVEDGFATIDFVDPSLRGPGLAKLFELGTPPELVEKLTRAPRAVYRVPEGNAREAGLLDDPPEPEDEQSEPGNAEDLEAWVSAENAYLDDVATWLEAEQRSQQEAPSEPDLEWSRKDIDAYAARLTPPLDTTGESNKQAALDAIAAAKEPSGA